MAVIRFRATAINKSLDFKYYLSSFIAHATDNQSCLSHRGQYEHKAIARLHSTVATAPLCLYALARSIDAFCDPSSDLMAPTLTRTVTARVTDEIPARRS